MLGVKKSARASHCLKPLLRVLFKLSTSVRSHQKATATFSSSREAFHDHSHLTICCLFGVQHARIEEISVDISLAQNASQNCCTSFVDHFVVIRQRESFFSSREAFHDYSHMRICCVIEVRLARCEEISNSISFPQNTSENCCSSLLDQFVVIKRQRESF